nr:ATP-binding protein [Corynebacterium sp. sy017]
MTGLALPAFKWIHSYVRKHRVATTLADNKITTISQVLHLTVQGSLTGVVVVERSGAVVLSNGRAHDLGLVHERTLVQEIQELIDEVLDDKETREIELKIRKRRTGSRITLVRAVVKPLTLADDRFVIVYASDESENARMESARRDFVANVSHELKTPVGGMALLSEALLEVVDDPEQVEYFATRLYKESHRLADMINELISLSRLQGAEALPDMESVSVNEVIEEALNRNILSAENAGIELRRSKAVDVSIMGDRNLLVTAVSNLISNAINYSPSAMPVTVSTKKVDDNTVHIRVTDHGIGISAEDQERVFERFFRVDKARSRSTGGTGLGLAIVKHVAANHGGHIKVWSRLGTGSTFTLELPIRQAKAHQEIPSEDIQPDLSLRSAATAKNTGSVISRATSRKKG